MKKGVLLTIAGAVMSVGAYAGTMCTNNDYLTVVLDPNIAGTSRTYSATAMTWKTVFPYGNVSGVAVCNDTSGSYGISSPNDMQETGGKYCWCKMTHPAVSLWVFYHAFSSSSDCADNCALYCGYYVLDYSAFRSGVFSSVGK